MALLLVLGTLFELGAKLFVKPELPWITVESACLDVLNYHQGMSRDVQLSVNTVVENHNPKTELFFLEVKFNITFHDTVIMMMASIPFNVPRKSVHPLRGQIQPHHPRHIDHDAGLRSVQRVEEKCTSTTLHAMLES